VSRKHRGADSERGWPVILAATAAFCLLATAPLILPLIHVHLYPTAATSSHGVKLLPAPTAPQAVTLPSVARPIDPAAAPAAPPAGNATREAAVVTHEDNRIRTLLRDASHILKPQLVSTSGTLPTLVLTATRGQYTSADLVKYRALVMLRNHGGLLLDNVFVAANARLSLGGSALRTLYLNNGRGGFATIVTWRGSLAFDGSASQPMTIIGWDRAARWPATDTGTGRSYIHDVGGRMTLSEVRVSSLGFWSGRTGGVAWTGTTNALATGGATSSTFTGSAYGAFVSRGSGIVFSDDLFESNELDGLHIHRHSIATSVLNSSAARNGGSGFSIGPDTRGVQLTGDVSEHNAGDGYFVNGKPLATSASASGGTTTPGSGTVIKDSAALHNGKIGILVEGGTGTVVEGDQVCAAVTAVAIRYNVTDAVVTGNDIHCSLRSGLSIGPGTPGLVVSGNSIAGARIGILLSASGPVKLDNNQITGATVFGISARGSGSAITGVDDVISGTGPRAIDARTNATTPALKSANISGWTSHNPVTFLSYLQYHPLAALWLGAAVLILMGWAWSHRHHLPSHPYASSRRRAIGPQAVASNAAATADPSLASLFTARESEATTTTPLRVPKAASSAAGALRRSRTTPATPTIPDMKAISGAADSGPRGSGSEWQRERRPANGRHGPGGPSGRGQQRISPGQTWPDAGGWERPASPRREPRHSAQARESEPGRDRAGPVPAGRNLAGPVPAGRNLAGPVPAGREPASPRREPPSPGREPRHSSRARESEPSWDSAGRRIAAADAAPGSAQSSSAQPSNAQPSSARSSGAGEFRLEPARPPVPNLYRGRRRSTGTYEAPSAPRSRPGDEP
jgi:hypothetical protein